MTRETPRPFGGRYSEWLDGADMTPRGSAPPEGTDRQLITAPLPKQQHTQPMTPLAPASAPAAKPPSERTHASAKPLADASPAPTKRAVAIQKDPVFDKLLNALEYDRPYIPEHTAETNGEPAAVHSAGPHAPPAGVDTPALEPRTKLSDSVVRELREGPRRAEPEPTPRDAPTVVTRSLPSALDVDDDTTPAGLPAPRAPSRIGRSLAILALFIVVGIGAIELFMRAPRAPKTPAPALAASSAATVAPEAEPAPALGSTEPSSDGALVAPSAPTAPPSHGLAAAHESAPAVSLPVRGAPKGSAPPLRPASKTPSAAAPSTPSAEAPNDFKPYDPRVQN